MFTKPDPETDIRLVFKHERSIVPLSRATNSYYWDQIPDDTEVWIVGLRYKDDSPYLALQKVITNERGFRDLKFKKVTIPELIEKLKVMDLE